MVRIKVRVMVVTKVVVMVDRVVQIKAQTQAELAISQLTRVAKAMVKIMLLK